LWRGKKFSILAREGFSVLGVDLSPTLTKKAIERFGRNTRIDHCVAEITSPPCLDIISIKELKDAISCTDEFESIEVIAKPK